MPHLLACDKENIALNWLCVACDLKLHKQSLGRQGKKEKKRGKKG